MIGQTFYLSPWWVEVVGFTPKRRFVRYRKISRGMTPIERISRARFERKARPA